jgi:predicted nucleotidyltransferase
MQVDLSKDKDLSEIITKLKSHFHPEKVYLFGSRAKGTSSSGSDYDLFLVLKNSNKRQSERMAEAYDLLWGRSVSVDILVYTEDEFNEAKSEFSSIAYSVATEGVEL